MLNVQKQMQETSTQIKVTKTFWDMQSKAKEMEEKSKQKVPEAWSTLSPHEQIVCLLTWKTQTLYVLDKKSFLQIHNKPILRALAAFLCCSASPYQQQPALFAEATGILLRDIVGEIDKYGKFTPELEMLFYQYSNSMPQGERHIDWNKKFAVTTSLDEIRYPFKDFLLGMNYSLDFQTPVLKNMKLGNGSLYDFKIYSFATVLVDAKERLKCQYCGNPLYPDFYYSKNSMRYELTLFNCSCFDKTYENIHDENVYINHCYHCKEMIDSRISSVQELTAGSQSSGKKGKGYYLCSVCGGGGSCTKPYRFCPGQNHPNPQDALSRSEEEIKRDKENGFFSCSICGHDGSSFINLPPIQVQSASCVYDEDDYLPF